MRLLFGRPLRAEGRQPDQITAAAVHLSTLSVSEIKRSKKGNAGSTEVSMIQKGLGLAFFILVAGTVAAAQSPAPVVTMSVTSPDGRTHELTAPESGLAMLTLNDDAEYAFRPTIQDSMPWNRIVVTIFKTATTKSPTQILGEVELKRGGPAVESKTYPSFKVAVPIVSPPAAPVSSTH
jgi:hypothetical protein